MTDGPVPAPDHGDNFHEPIEHWGSAPGPRASLIVGQDEQGCYGSRRLLHTMMKEEMRTVMAPSERALQSLITATGNHVTLGTPCVAADEIPVTDEMIAAALPYGLGESGARWLYRAMAAVAPESERYWADEFGKAQVLIARAEDRVAALEADNAALVAAQDAAISRITELEAQLVFADTLEADNAALQAKLATFGPVAPADLPDPPRRADGTLAPQPRRLPGVAELPPEKRVGG